MDLSNESTLIMLAQTRRYKREEIFFHLLRQNFTCVTFPQNTLRPRFANQRTDTGEFLFTVHACRRAGGDPEASGARA